MVNISKEIRIVWNIFSVSIMLFLVYLFAFNSNFIINNVPTCSSILLYNKPCILCGMSRAFLKLKQFDLAGALAFNKGSIYLFAIFIINTIFYILSFKKVVYENS